MAEGVSELRRDIILFLSSLRQSIERPFHVKRPTLDADRERFMRAMMAVEEARIRFNTYTRYRGELTAVEWAAARDELLSFVNNFVHADYIDSDVYDRRFRVSPMMNRDRNNPSPFVLRLLDKGGPVTVADALISFRSYLEETRVEFSPVQVVLSFEDLERIVPPQQVAPVQFDVVNGRIVVTSRSPRTAEADRCNIQSALEHIKGSGDQLINNLENSNCDKRLLDSVKELQSQLVSDGNIIKIGLTNMACGVMSAQFQSELGQASCGDCSKAYREGGGVTLRHTRIRD